MSWEATGFWLAVALLFGGFFCAQRAADRARKESEDRLDRRADELAILIRTLPPEDFVSALGETYWRCSRTLAALEDASERPTRDIVERHVRAVLRALAVLAQKFDGTPRGTIYAANVMRYRPVPALDSEERVRVRARLKFAEPETDLASLDGVLDLDLVLSVAVSDLAQTSEPEVDSTLKLMALPIPKPEALKSADGKRWRVLPGAPLALVLARSSEHSLMDAYADTATLGEWCRKNGDFSESVAQAVKAHFQGEGGSRVRSMVSLPLRSLGDDADVPAICNIHSDAPGILRQDVFRCEGVVPNSSAEQFAYLVGPLLTNLLNSLILLDSVG